MQFEIYQAVFFEFDLWFVKEIQEGRVTAVVDSFGITSGENLNPFCFPRDMFGESITETYRASYQRLRELTNSKRLNFPDIKAWYVEQWRLVMLNRRSKFCVAEGYRRLAKFEGDVIAGVKVMESLTSDDVRIFR
jgi:hypothetical protein